jgi:hypothetical protein
VVAIPKLDSCYGRWGLGRNCITVDTVKILCGGCACFDWHSLKSSSAKGSFCIWFSHKHKKKVLSRKHRYLRTAKRTTTAFPTSTGNSFQNSSPNFIIGRPLKLFLNLFRRWWMPSSGVWRRVDVVDWTDVSEDRIASLFRVEKSASEEPAWAGSCSLERARSSDWD